MRKSRFSEQRIVGVLQEYDAGANVSALCRKHGISTTTLYKRRSAISYGFQALMVVRG